MRRRTIHDLPEMRGFRRQLRTHGTPAEATLWRALKRSRLEGRRFRRPHGIGPDVVDFYCPTERLAVELDSAVHDDPVRRDYDSAREAYLSGLGSRVVRFENQMVFQHLEEVLEEIARHFWGR
jgi:very-short-patch-repair endonuclease